MLSILIPIYNWLVVDLVQNLHKQCLQEQIDFEIILLDDASTATPLKEQNRILRTLPNVNYQELSQNIGRASIRNLLGKTATFPYLLFIDADATISQESFIKSYLSNIQENTLLYGGCQYSNNPPIDKSKQLHYHYGKKREAISLANRKATPYTAFKTFNFLIPKATFLAIQFDEDIREYGHEDTLFGQELEKRKIPVLHLDNPLEHTGLETTPTFLNKQQQALNTLHQLYKNGKNPDSRLIQTYKKIQKWRVDGLVYKLLDDRHSFITKQLHKKNPNLLYLDLYKLHFWLQLQN